MTTHILSLTYAPKIPLVKSGECTQTIRLHNPEKPKKIGDKLILHTWAGKPYRSRWDWRLETEITQMHKMEFRYKANGGFRPLLDGEEMNYITACEIAELDGMVSASGFEMVDILVELNGFETIGGTVWDIIRWPKPKVVE